MSLTVLREMTSLSSAQNRRKPHLFPLLVRAADQAMAAGRFLGEAGGRMPVKTNEVRLASRLNATMRAAILILAG